MEIETDLERGSRVLHTQQVVTLCRKLHRATDGLSEAAASLGLADRGGVERQSSRRSAG